jgi:hypothetical protein
MSDPDGTLHRRYAPCGRVFRLTVVKPICHAIDALGHANNVTDMPIYLENPINNGSAANRLKVISGIYGAFLATSVKNPSMLISHRWCEFHQTLRRTSCIPSLVTVVT